TGPNSLRFAWFAWAPGIALAISLMLVHSVYWSNMRMRGPAVPVISLLAACGVARLGRRQTGMQTGQKRPFSDARESR
ncbi:MAG: hypothetical protein ACK5PZ_08170, partial [Pirellula sp.]